ncbi:MAG TPA: lipid-A-disaccharide synthase [Burkholderiaceae bacterium]|nr:lipid-A-disaccharide synthase [Burkholderiaceae bacterium]
MSQASSIAFVAGEASGDVLAAGVLAELRRREPGTSLCGVGGDRMIEAGFDAWHHVRELSVRGYVEVLRHLPRLLRLRGELLQRVSTLRPRVFVGVDAPDFNLGLEEKLRARGVRTVQMVSPSVWAWRRERMGQIRRAVDHMLLVFPFEQALYDDAGIPATYVGHPLAAVIPLEPDAAAARARLGLAPHETLVAVLPGSRPDEVRYLGPTFVAAMARMKSASPGLSFVLPVADPSLLPVIEQALRQHPQLAGCVALTAGRSHDCLEACDVVLVASGTATLEAALYKRPMVISYRTPWLSAWIIRRKGYIPYLGLPNIMAGEFVVPELLQDAATPEALARAVLDQLGDRERGARLAARFTEMHHALKRDTPRLAADAILGEADR